MRRITKASVLAIGLAAAGRPAIAEQLTSEVAKVACPERAALTALAALLRVGENAIDLAGQYGCFFILPGTRISGPLAITDLYMRVRIDKTRQAVWVFRGDVDP